MADGAKHSKPKLRWNQLMWTVRAALRKRSCEEFRWLWALWLDGSLVPLAVKTSAPPLPLLKPTFMSSCLPVNLTEGWGRNHSCKKQRVLDAKAWNSGDESCLPLFFTLDGDSLVSHEIDLRVVTIQKPQNIKDAVKYITRRKSECCEVACVCVCTRWQWEMCCEPCCIKFDSL